jgi:predicted glycoside hydrolase/deacetylase ChbG (UPF0249 family)
MKRLIVNGDDFGLTAGVSRGVLEAHRAGIVTSTTAMVGSPHAADAIRQAIQSAPNLGIGLHLTVSGAIRPVLPPAAIPSLVREDGQFYPFDEWLTRYDRFDPGDIARELTAQCERFVEIAGRAPDHLDSHHHAVYRHPAGLRALFDLAARYDIPIRNYWSDRPLDQAVPNSLADIPASAFDAAVTGIKAVLDAGPIPARPARFDESFFDQTATLGMCHPAYADETLDSAYTDKREAELRVLTHASVREVIKAEGIELIGFAAL